MATLQDRYASPTPAPLTVTVLSQEDRSWEAATAVYRPIDADLHVYAVAPPVRTGRVTLLVQNLTEQNALLAYLAPGHAYTLDCQGTWPAFDGIHFVVTRWDETWRGSSPTGPRQITLDYTRVTSTPPQVFP